MVDVTNAAKKLKKDLYILEAMAADMNDYLISQSLFWPLSDTSMPRLTLGGYLMRQHRLNRLRNVLEQEDQDRLDKAIEKFNEALVEKIVRFEQRAHDELHARLRQWSEYLKDIGKESVAAGAYYASAVETRLIIALLLEKLEMPPYELDKRVLGELGSYDTALRNYWFTGEFVWYHEWRPAYPKESYWWLYGLPRD